MALPKLFQRIFWHNDTTPALNEDNLNAMSKAIDDIDDRVIEQEGNIMESVANAHTYMLEAKSAAENAASSEQTALRASYDAQRYKTDAQDAANAAITNAGIATQAAQQAEEAAAQAEEIVKPTEFYVDFDTGLLMYTQGDVFNFYIDKRSGDLMWEVYRRKKWHRQNQQAGC